MTEHNPIRLSKPRVRVVMDRPEGMTEYTVQTDNRDAVRFDVMRAGRKWPGPEDGAVTLWLTVLAWNALRRSLPEFADLKVDKFLEDAADVEAIDENGNPIKGDAVGTEAGPTQAVAESD